MGINKRSFTLIEVIIVIGVVAMSVPALFGLIFSIINQQAKIYRLSEVKKQGDLTITSLNQVVKNYAVDIYSNSSLTAKRCDTAGSRYPTSGTSDGSTFYFKDQFGNSIRFYRYTSGGNSFIASESARPAGSSPQRFLLTANNIRILANSFTISCSRTALYSSPIVEIRLTLEYNTSSTRPDEKASLTYRSSVKLRSF